MPLGARRAGPAKAFDVFRNDTGAVVARNITAAAVVASYCTDLTAQEVIDGVAAKHSLLDTTTTPDYVVTAHAAVHGMGILKPVNKTAPAITGTPQSGQTLTCSDGVWDGYPTLSRQWKRDLTTNIGTNQATYVCVAGDVGHKISCVVTGTNNAGATSVQTAETATVTA